MLPCHAPVHPSSDTFQLPCRFSRPQLAAFVTDETLVFKPDDGCPFESLRVGKTVGRGAFASVRAAAGIRDGRFEIVALKISCESSLCFALLAVCRPHMTSFSLVLCLLLLAHPCPSNVGSEGLLCA